jgi:hypothetical protein
MVTHDTQTQKTQPPTLQSESESELDSKAHTAATGLVEALTGLVQALSSQSPVSPAATPVTPRNNRGKKQRKGNNGKGGRPAALASVMKSAQLNQQFQARTRLLDYGRDDRQESRLYEQTLLYMYILLGLSVMYLGWHMYGVMVYIWHIYYGRYMDAASSVDGRLAHRRGKHVQQYNLECEASLRWRDVRPIGAVALRDVLAAGASSTR